MAFDIKPISGRNSSAIIAYFLRSTETGWFVTTDVLKDANFLSELKGQVDTKRQLITDKLDETLPNGKLKLPSSKRQPLIERLALLSSKIPKVEGQNQKAQSIVSTIHAASNSMLLDRADARTGEIFQIPLPRSTNDQKCASIAKAVRDLFPKDCPMVITIHHGNGKNPHLQGWFSDRAWDIEKSQWTSPLQQFRSKTGLQEFRASIDNVIEKMGASWSVDPDAPKRTVFHPAKSQFMKKLSRDDLLKGDFLKDVQNPVLKQCLSEEIDRARYFEAKYQREKSTTYHTTVEETFNLFKTSLQTQNIEKSTENNAISQENEILDLLSSLDGKETSHVHATSI